MKAGEMLRFPVWGLGVRVLRCGPGSRKDWLVDFRVFSRFSPETSCKQKVC